MGVMLGCALFQRPHLLTVEKRSWRGGLVIICQRPFVLILLPVHVTDLNAALMVALPGITLFLSHSSSLPGVGGLLLLFWQGIFACDLGQVSQMTGVAVISSVRKSWVQDTTSEVGLGMRGFLG